MRFARAIALTAGLVFGGFSLAIAKVSPKPEQTWVDQAIEKGRTVPGVDKVIEKLSPSPMMGRMVVGAMPAKGP